MVQLPHTVLIVEDERHLADLYAAWLDDDYDVRTAYDGSDALDTLSNEIDVVLLDRRMPELSGDAVLAEIRERGLDCQIAMVTAVEPDFDVLEMGFDDYLTKPVSRDKLAEVIETLLTRAEYDAETQRYFRLVSKRAALEAEMTEAELSNSPRYAALLTEIEQLEDRLSTITSDFSHDDFRSRFHTFDPNVRDSAERSNATD